MALLEASGIGKNFGDTKVLKDDVHTGTIQHGADDQGYEMR